MGASIIIGIFGFLMAKVLTRPGEIFGFLPLWFGKRWAFDLDSLPVAAYWLAKVTWACGKCIAGNLALWYSLIIEPKAVFFNVVLAIFVAYQTTRVNERFFE